MEEPAVFSQAPGKDLRAEAATDGGGMFLDSENGVRAAGPDRGDIPSGGSTRDGDAESGGALNGWKDMDDRLATPGPLSLARTAARPTGLAFATARGLREDELGGDGDVAPDCLAARRAEIGLALVVGPTWWNVERLPYARLGSGSSTVLFSRGADPTSGLAAFMLDSRLGSDGRKTSSSAPMNRELSRASESSTRNSQLFR